MKKLVLPLLIVALLFWIFIDKCSHNVSEDAFTQKQDSLNYVVDSLEVNIVKRDSVIDELYKVNIELDYQIDHQQEKIKIVTKYVDSSKQKIDTYTENELIFSFNQRYPKDTTTSPLPLAQPVLVEVAKDLVELDGTKKIIIVKDSIIGLVEDKVVLRDSIITHFSDKEANYKSIIGIKNTQINDYKIKHEFLKLENKKLKIKANIGKIGAGLAIVGLTFLLIK